jgi:hypothetical protein
MHATITEIDLRSMKLNSGLRIRKTKLGVCGFGLRALDFGLWTLDLGLNGRHRIVAAFAPWMTSANAPGRQPAAGERAVVFEGFNGVVRTTRLKPALRGGPEQKSLGRRQRHLIDPHQKNQNMWNGIHAGRREKAEGRMKNAEMRRSGRVDLGFFILSSAFFIALTVPLYAAMSKSPFPPRRNLCPQLKPARRGLNPPVAPNRVDAGERPPVRAGAPDCGPRHCRSCRW